MSERRYRFEVDNLMPHAPRKPGVYQFTADDERGPGRVLFVGCAIPDKGETIYHALAGHFMGNRRPSKETLLRASPNIYFEHLTDADVSSVEDYLDIAGALIARHKPPLNPDGPSPASGRYGSIELQETAPRVE